jgi:hypothetical protein
VVGGVPGKIHPLTSAIYGRKVNLNSGVFAGCALDDLLEGLSFNNATLKSVNDNFLRPLMSEIAPNAAKALGPFWARRPYFAKYATTIQVVFPPTPLFGAPSPVPVVTPIPLPSKNILVPVSRALAHIYSVTLNLSLGENFYTHTDSWIFGEGVVPMVPQVSLNEAASAIGNLGNANLASLDPETILKDFVQSAGQELLEYVVVEVMKGVVKEVAMKVIPYAGLVGLGTDFLGDLADGLGKKEDKKNSAGGGLTSAITDSIASAGKNTLDMLAAKFSLDDKDKFLREYNGVLVYAEDTLDVSGKNATGLFMAQNKLTMKAQTCVGTLVSRQGDIECTSNLLFYPYFNRASLYVPKATANGWLERALQFQYDSAFKNEGSPDQAAVDVGPPALPAKISAQGWAQ